MILSWRPLDHAEYRASSWFPGLAGLRALAALAVVFFHYGGPVVDRLQGWIAVQLFFVLSGFLITTLALREEDRTDRISLRDFYLRRVFRIIPVYLLLLGLTTLAMTLAGTYHSSRLGDAMPYYLTFFNEVVDYNTPYPTSWSLGVEEKFYLVWPALLVLTSFARTGRTALRLMLGIGAVGFVLAVLPLAPAHQWASLTVHYGSLVVGCLLALALHHPRGFAVLRPLTSPAAAVLVALGFCVLQLSVEPLVQALGGNWQFVVPFYAVGAALLLVAVIARGPVRRVLASRPLTYIGDRSYALYLAQTGAAAVAGVLLPTGLPKAVATSAVALLFACGLRRWVEQPAIAFGRRLINAARASRVR
ncbi:acyltransferase [Amycolatopsis endophytica]|uniref:Peptidoglycan/LPS O-acetylase OafA/YrhL n=1 Tax=Amycolatopsis endophytica TaxID=860233 RepID=A0A853BFE2_9PSEU|nr:acyltransferase [Amycolatopsis endophytica]NYI93392.1 peptidoglycan/LPS O-acetylase OafA/YrhL [Amycolatopsis endophytica]